MKKTKKLFKENKVFRRVLAVVLSLSIIAGVAAVIAMAAPQPKAASPKFELPTYEEKLQSDYATQTHYRYLNYGANRGTIKLSNDGRTATAEVRPDALGDFGDRTAGNPDGHRLPFQFVCWTTDPEGTDIYSYSPTITPNDDRTYYPWFAQKVIYVEQTYRSDSSECFNTSAFRGWFIATDNLSLDENNATWVEITGKKVGPTGLVFRAAWGLDNPGKRWNDQTIFVLPRYKLLEEATRGDTDYTYHNFPVTMFDYDMAKFNEQHRGYPDTIKFLDCDNNPQYSGYTNAAPRDGATQQIWSSRLVNGVPVPYGHDKTKLLVPEEAANLATWGYQPGGDSNLFAPNDTSTLDSHGKQGYTNVLFQFLRHETGDSAGYYEYNSAMNHVYFDQNANTVKPYYESLRRNLGDKRALFGGFYPFDEIGENTTNGASTWGGFRKYTDWESEFEGFVETDSNISEQKASYYGTAKIHHGMTLDFDFYLPENGTVDGTPGGQPITFEFSGDDDLWVYIDDELVLDIGGGHGPVSGSINFKNQQSWVENATQRDGADYAAKNVGAVTQDINVETDQIHNIKIFYLERYAGESNCRIMFNLPPIPPATVNVKKDVKTLDGTDVTSNTDDFTFKLNITDQDGSNKSTANYPFEIVNNQNEVIRSDTTDANGNFKLKADQTARFSNFLATDKFSVTEYIDNTAKYNRVYIDDVPQTNYGSTSYGTTPIQITNKGQTVIFTNILTDPLATAQLNKKASYNEADGSYTITLSATDATPGRNITVTDTVTRYFDVIATNPAVTPTVNADGTTTVKLNGTTDANGDWTGTITIKPKAEFWGGNAVPTNVGNPVFNSDAGIPHEITADPKVNVAPNLPKPIMYHHTIYLGQYVNIPEMLAAGLHLGDMPTIAGWEDDFLKKDTPNFNFSPGESDTDVDDDKGTIRHVGEYETYGWYSLTPLYSGTNLPGPEIIGKVEVRNTSSVTVLGCTLTINKTAEDMSALAGHNFIFNIKGSPEGNVLEQKINHKVVLNADNDYTATIKDLPIGTYTVQEEGWSWRFEATGDGKIVLEPNAEKDHGEITITNSKTQTNWLDHENNKNNVFKNN